MSIVKINSIINISSTCILFVHQVGNYMPGGYMSKTQVHHRIKFCRSESCKKNITAKGCTAKEVVD